MKTMTTPSRACTSTGLINFRSSALALAARVRAELLKSMADVSVQARDGSVVVSTRASSRQKRKKVETIKQLAGQVQGVGYVEVHAQNSLFKKTP